MPEDKKSPTKKTLLQKQIPTILGLLILVVGLVVGVVFLGQGTGVFSPRATPETTPRSIRLTNVTDSSFTVSFATTEATAGFVKYGAEPGKLNSQSSDDRDQLSGTVEDFLLHHVTVRGLQPNTQYYYVLGTGSGATFDSEGAPFAVTTAQRNGAPSAAKTAYGTVLTPAGTPADGSIVYVALDGVGDMSSLVKSSGSWAVPLSNARTADGSSYASVVDEDSMSLTVQGTDPSLNSQFSVLVGQTQPVATVTLGEVPEASEVAAGGVDTTPTQVGQNPIDLTTSQATQSSSTNQSESASSSAANTGGLLDELLAQASQSESTGSAVVDLNNDEPQVISTSQPKIEGTAKPNVVVNIEVNSETQIIQTVTADSNGNFELDLEELKQNLEPGEHTVTINYTDPDTQEVTSKTVNFTVEGDTSTHLAQANTGSSSSSSSGTQPFGSGNPIPIGGATQSASTSSSSGSTSTRSALPSTSSAVPVSGSVGTTLALVIGGLFFITAGGWSYWLGQQLEVEEVTVE